MGPSSASYAICAKLTQPCWETQSRLLRCSYSYDHLKSSIREKQRSINKFGSPQVALLDGRIVLTIQRISNKELVVSTLSSFQTPQLPRSNIIGEQFNHLARYMHSLRSFLTAFSPMASFVSPKNMRTSIFGVYVCSLLQLNYATQHTSHDLPMKPSLSNSLHGILKK